MNPGSSQDTRDVEYKHIDSTLINQVNKHCIFIYVISIAIQDLCIKYCYTHKYTSMLCGGHPLLHNKNSTQYISAYIFNFPMAMNF